MLEDAMHDLDRTQLEMRDDGLEFAEEGEFAAASPFSEAEEVALATELLGVTSEEELDQFLGKLFRRVGRTLGKVVRPFGGILKSVAKKALPFVGGALGSLIPVPGVGTAVGTALGSAASKLFELEVDGLSEEEQEFEVARRFVRLAGATANSLAQAGPAATPAAARNAVIAAARQHAPGLVGMLTGAGAVPAAGGGSGRWIRRGRHIILLGI
jgi:uncharacterized protein (DUF697 family)